MGPDLGKYAVTVLSAYAASLVVLLVLVGLTLRRGRKIRARMEDMENRTNRHG
ncbi:MAG: heme exporter protein CcmD [Marinibacterium sp.]